MENYQHYLLVTLLDFKEIMMEIGFLTLILTGDTTGADLGQVGVLDGNTTYPGLSFIDDSNTGFYRIGSGAIGMTLNGVHKHRFESDGDTVFGGNSVEAVQSWSIQPNQDDGAARIFIQ